MSSNLVTTQLPPCIDTHGGDLPARFKRKQIERSIPGFPNVSVLTYPETGKAIFRYRCIEPGTDKRVSVVLGDAKSLSPFMVASLVGEIDAQIANGISPKLATLILNSFFYLTYLEWAKVNKRSSADDLSRFNTHVKSILGDHPLCKITREHVLVCLERVSEQRSPATRNRVLMLLRSIFNLAVNRKVVPTNPCIGIKPLRENTPEVQSLETDEIAHLMEILAHEPPVLVMLIQLLLQTGARVGEILNLEWTDINERLPVIHLRETKAGVPQTLPLSPAVKSLTDQLRQLPVVHPLFLFPSNKGDGPMSPPYKWLRNVFQKAGLPYSGFHVFRKTMATQAVVSAGLDVYTVSKLLRHASVRTTEKHYLAMHQRRLAAAALRVSEVLPTLPPLKQIGGVP